MCRKDKRSRLCSLTCPKTSQAVARHCACRSREGGRGAQRAQSRAWQVVKRQPMATLDRSATTKHGSSYIPGLDGIRAIAFLLVFGAHATPGAFSHYVPATLGVTIFFFLSGFLITTLLRKELDRTGTLCAAGLLHSQNAAHFYPVVHRVRAGGAVHATTCCTSSAATSQGRVERRAVLLQLCDRNARSNGALPAQGMDVAWSLSVEEHFYILFPLLFLTLARRSLVPAQADQCAARAVRRASCCGDTSCACTFNQAGALDILRHGRALRLDPVGLHSCDAQ